jgi:hypothetical protein
MFRKPCVHHKEDHLYMHLYKQSSRWKDVLERNVTCTFFHQLDTGQPEAYTCNTKKTAYLSKRGFQLTLRIQVNNEVRTKWNSPEKKVGCRCVKAFSLDGKCRRFGRTGCEWKSSYAASEKERRVVGSGGSN